MSAVLDNADPASLAVFDEIIDVRTPAEFSLDHVPGAVNLPVLSDDERALVGTIYVQDSRMKARRIGAALVARNIATHLERALRDKPGSFAPLVYCWRRELSRPSARLRCSAFGMGDGISIECHRVCFWP